MKEHDYASSKRGSDMPWWGASFFSENAKGVKTMVVAQDSNSPDASSVVFYAPLLPFVNNREEYNKYTNRLNDQFRFHFGSWIRVKNRFKEWGLEVNNLFLTDASKVYKQNSWKNRDFDKELSRKLLEEEIDFCKPELIIFLGRQPCELFKKENLWKTVDTDEYAELFGVRTVVSPFITGAAQSAKGYEQRLYLATQKIRKLTMS